MRTSLLAGICMLLAASAALAQPENVQPQTIVFVHGAWGGGWDYKTLEKRLESKGHDVRRVTLTGLGERSHLMSRDINLDTHIMDVVNTIKFDDLEDIILVGHSYGGMVITGVAHRIPEKINHIVYVDAMLPIDGESVLDLQPPLKRLAFMGMIKLMSDGISLPPLWPGWEETKDVPHPLATFEQPVSLGNPKADNLAATYVLTIEADAEEDDFSRYAERAKSRDWHYVEWQTGHNAQRTMVDEYVKLLINL